MRMDKLMRRLWRKVNNFARLVPKMRRQETKHQLLLS